MERLDWQAAREEVAEQRRELCVPCPAHPYGSGEWYEQRHYRLPWSEFFDGLTIPPSGDMLVGASFEKFSQFYHELIFQNGRVAWIIRYHRAGSDLPRGHMHSLEASAAKRPGESHAYHPYSYERIKYYDDEAADTTDFNYPPPEFNNKEELIWQVLRRTFRNSSGTKEQSYTYKHEYQFYRGQQEREEQPVFRAITAWVCCYLDPRMPELAEYGGWDHAIFNSFNPDKLALELRLPGSSLGEYSLASEGCRHYLKKYSCDCGVCHPVILDSRATGSAVKWSPMSMYRFRQLRDSEPAPI